MPPLPTDFWSEDDAAPPGVTPPGVTPPGVTPDLLDGLFTKPHTSNLWLNVEPGTSRHLSIWTDRDGTTPMFRKEHTHGAKPLFRTYMVAASCPWRLPIPLYPSQFFVGFIGFSDNALKDVQEITKDYPLLKHGLVHGVELVHGGLRKDSFTPNRHDWRHANPQTVVDAMDALAQRVLDGDF